MIGTVLGRERRKAGVAVLLVCLLISGLAVAAVPAIAEDDETESDDLPGYYDDRQVHVDNESWMDGNEDATISNVSTMLSRISSFVIGGDSSGDTSGSLLTGMLVFGAIMGIFVGGGVGMVAGAVLTVFALFAGGAVGIAPTWLYPVALFGVGVLLSASVKRALE